MTLFSASRTVHTRFCGYDCLYFDHNGLRVIADVEGHGRFQVTGDTIAIMIDGKPQAGATEFDEQLLVLAEAGAECETVALLGPDPGAGKTASFNGRAEGCGWVVSSDGPVVIDESHAPVPSPAEGSPLPFFQSAVSTGEMQVSFDQHITAKTIDRFDTADQEALKAREWEVQNGSDLFELESRFDDGSSFTAMHMSHLNSARWTAKVPYDNKGLVIRKLYDRFHGRQRARVLVDGVHAGWWYEPEQSRRARWAWATFGVPQELTENRDEVRISVDPPAGVPLWDVSRLELIAILPQ